MKNLKIKQYSIFTIQFEEDYIYNYILLGDKLYNVLQDSNIYGIDKVIPIKKISDDFEYKNHNYFDKVIVTDIYEPRYYESIYNI